MAGRYGGWLSRGFLNWLRSRAVGLAMQLKWSWLACDGINRGSLKHRVACIAGKPGFHRKAVALSGRFQRAQAFVLGSTSLAIISPNGPVRLVMPRPARLA